MNVTIEDITSAPRYFEATRDCDTSVNTVQASIAISPKEKMLYSELNCVAVRSIDIYTSVRFLLTPFRARDTEAHDSREEHAAVIENIIP